MQTHVDQIERAAGGLQGPNGADLSVARAFTSEVPSEIPARDLPALVLYSRDCTDLDLAEDGTLIQGTWGYELQLVSPVEVGGGSGGGHEAATARWRALVAALSAQGFQVVKPRGSAPVVRHREGYFGSDKVISCTLSFTKIG